MTAPLSQLRELTDTLIQQAAEAGNGAALLGALRAIVAELRASRVGTEVFGASMGSTWCSCCKAKVPVEDTFPGHVVGCGPFCGKCRPWWASSPFEEFGDGCAHDGSKHPSRPRYDEPSAPLIDPDSGVEYDKKANGEEEDQDSKFGLASLKPSTEAHRGFVTQSSTSRVSAADVDRWLREVGGTALSTPTDTILSFARHVLAPVQMSLAFATRRWGEVEDELKRARSELDVLRAKLEEAERGRELAIADRIERDRQLTIEEGLRANETARSEKAEAELAEVTGKLDALRAVQPRKREMADADRREMAAIKIGLESERVAALQSSRAEPGRSVTREDALGPDVAPHQIVALVPLTGEGRS